MYFRTLTKTVILVLFCIFLTTACNKDEFTNYEYITPGCIPSKIILKEPMFGGTEDDFIYDGGYLNRIGPNVYKYSKGLVSEISTYSDRYTKFYYNSAGIIIRTELYRIPFREDDFKLAAEYEYIYSENRIIKVLEHIDDESFDLYYRSGTNNLDSMHTYDATGILTRRDIYEHDNYKNIYTNLKLPHAAYLFWLQYRAGDNNITKHSIFDYSLHGRNNIFKYTYEYNSFGYPVKRIQGDAMWDIEYINCE